MATAQTIEVAFGVRVLAYFRMATGQFIVEAVDMD